LQIIYPDFQTLTEYLISKNSSHRGYLLSLVLANLEDWLEASKNLNLEGHLLTISAENEKIP
jgi:hypothetical protein